MHVCVSMFTCTCKTGVHSGLSGLLKPNGQGWSLTPLMENISVLLVLGRGGGGSGVMEVIHFLHLK